MGLRTILGLRAAKPPTRAARGERVKYEVGGRAKSANDTWYRGDSTNFAPDKQALQEPDALARYVGKGWLPKAPFISRDDPITTFGSCFARHITRYLDEAGYDVADRERRSNSYVIRCGEGMVNSAAIMQQFAWAYDEIEFNEPLWYDRSGSEVGYEDAIRRDTRIIFDRSNVFIITLGLSEVWYNKNSGNVFWRTIPKDRFDPELHGFKVLTVAENRENLDRIHALIRKYRPDASIIITLSPVPLVATFRPISCITANSVSKASLRVAIDEFMRERRYDEKVFYFPSYEIVRDFADNPFNEDLRHINTETVSMIMEFFARNYLIDPIKADIGIDGN